MSAATYLKERLRADLTLAMRARDNDTVRLLRALIAALDNAEAVPEQAGAQRLAQRAFGDPSGEIARAELDAAAVDIVLDREAAERLAAAESVERGGQAEASARLRAEAARIARYRS